jgi:hypothetical protein
MFGVVNLVAIIFYSLPCPFACISVVYSISGKVIGFAGKQEEARVVARSPGGENRWGLSWGSHLRLCV